MSARSQGLVSNGLSLVQSGMPPTLVGVVPENWGKERGWMWWELDGRRDTRDATGGFSWYKSSKTALIINIYPL